MSAKKPSPGLTAGLVAVKGTAAPPADAGVTRAAPVAVQPAKAPAGEPASEPLNFRVTAAFRRDFRVYAAENNLKLNELLVLAFNAYKAR